MITNFTQALSYLRQSVPTKSKRFPGTLGLDRQKEILRRLNNPQDKIKTIHIAGTSGKGSTAFYISSLLSKQGFKVGLTVSPHLLDIRERCQINNQLISQKEFIFYLNQIIPIIEDIKKTNFGKPTFFEILIALAFHIFSQKEVDYAIIETGLGGLMDGSNVINSPDKIVVLTKIGLDHTNVLGKNLTAIAAQKAGIIHPHNPCFSIQQKPTVKKIFDTTANSNQTSINYISPKINFKNIKNKNNFLEYNFNFNHLKLANLQLNSLALYQVENSALALSVIEYLSIRDRFVLNYSKIRSTLSLVSFNGRLEIITLNNQKIILDGAHNPQKMSAFIKSLKKSFPNQKFIFLLAFKQRNDFSKMIKMIIPLADQIILTRFKVVSDYMIQISQKQSSLNKVFNNLGFFEYKYIPDKLKALNYVLKMNQSVVITGSLYLLGDIYPLLNKLKN